MKAPSPYLVSSRKFRPQRFDQVVGQEVCIRTLKNALRLGRVANAYLFSGPRGTGKTTLVRILAKALNCPHCDAQQVEPCGSCAVCQEIATGQSLDVLEIDGASNRGIDDIRTLSETVGYSPAKGRYKIFIIDEVHMLTKEAFNALLKTLEEPPSTAKFFFATTEPHKIPETILSRCQRFNLRRLSSETIVQKLSLIAQENGLSIDQNVLATISQYADGGLRDAESLFDQLSSFSSDGQVTLSLVEEVLGLAPLSWFEELDEAISQGTTEVAFQLADKLVSESKDVGRFIEDLILHFRTAYLIKIQAKYPSSFGPHASLLSLTKLIASLQEEQFSTIFHFIQESMKALRLTSSPRFILEKLLLDLISVRYEVPLPYIVKRLMLLEEKIVSRSQSTSETIFVQGQASVCSAEPTVPTKQPLPLATIERPTPPKAHNAEQEKQRQENLMQFATVELQGVLQKKKR